MSDSDLSPVQQEPTLPNKAVECDDSSDEETSQSDQNTQSSTSESSGPRVNGVNQLSNGTTDTDTEEDVMEKDETSKEETAVTAVTSFSQAGEPELKTKKDTDSSDTEEEDPSEAEIDGKAASKAQPDFDDENAREIDDMIRGLKSQSPEPARLEEEKVLEPAEEEADEEDEEPSIDQTRSPSPPLRSPSPEERSRSPTPERKDSRGSNGSSSLDDERASSLSPEPPKVIATPSTKVTSPVMSPSSPAPTSQTKSPITKIYTDKILSADSDGEEAGPKAVRQKPASDITQIYTQKLVQSDSPKPERASRVKPARDITQLYTAALHKEDKSPSRAGDLPKRTGDITKLYTGGLGSADTKPFKGKPNDERTAPTKHNMATSVDKNAIKEAYAEVMADNNGIEWATFIFKDNILGVTGKGSQFNEFKSQFGPDDRGFGYMKVMTGDEMSKRSKFVFCTWVGPNVSVMKKAKMSTDKALMKELIQNLSVELQVENANEFTMDNFKAEVDKAGGARYGTGVRDH